MEHKSDGDTSCNWCTRYSHQKIGTETGGLGNKRTSGDHLNYNIVEIGQNTEKSPGDLKRLAVTQTPVRKHQLTWSGKNSHMSKKIIISNLMLINKKKKTCLLVNFVVATNQNENENIDKYLDLARELKRLWNMKMTVIPIVVRTRGMVPKDLEKSL